MRGAGNRAPDRHAAPRYQARERARQRLRRTATERLRDRAHRRWIRNGDRVLHRHHRLHRARGAGRKSADGRVRRVLPWRHDLRADRRDSPHTSARPARTSSRTTCASVRRPCRTCVPRESLPMCARRSRRRCRWTRPNRQASAAEFGRELQLAQRHNGLIPDSMALSEPVADQRDEGADATQPLGSGHTGTPVPTFGAPPPPTGGPPPPAGTPAPMAEAPTRHAMHLASLPWVAQQAGAPPAAHIRRRGIARRC